MNNIRITKYNSFPYQWERENKRLHNGALGLERFSGGIRITKGIISEKKALLYTCYSKKIPVLQISIWISHLFSHSRQWQLYSLMHLIEQDFFNSVHVRRNAFIGNTYQSQQFLPTKRRIRISFLTLFTLQLFIVQYYISSNLQ